MAEPNSSLTEPENYKKVFSEVARLSPASGRKSQNPRKAFFVEVCAESRTSCLVNYQVTLVNLTAALNNVPGVQYEGDGEEQQWVLEGERKVEEPRGLAPDHAAGPHAKVGDEPVDGGGDEDERDEEVADGEEEEGPVRLLPDAAAADEGEQEAQVEHEAGDDGEAEQAGIAPTVKPANIRYTEVN